MKLKTAQEKIRQTRKAFNYARACNFENMPESPLTMLTKCLVKVADGDKDELIKWYRKTTV